MTWLLERVVALGVAAVLLFVLGLRADLVGIACGVGLLALGTLLGDRRDSGS